MKTASHNGRKSKEMKLVGPFLVKRRFRGFYGYKEAH